jgi:hypothetical protein
MEEGKNNTQKKSRRRFERKGDMFIIKIKGSVGPLLAVGGMRGAQEEFFLHLPPDFLTLTDIGSHLRTPETEGDLSVT